MASAITPLVSEYAVIDQFLAAMREKGIDLDEPIIADGKLHRYHVEGDHRSSQNAWARLHIDEHPAGVFGCHKRYPGKEKFTWSMQGTRPLTPAERAELKAVAKARAAQRKAEQDLRHLAAKARALELYMAAEPVGVESHPYLTFKDVPISPALRVGNWYRIDEDTGEQILVSSNALLVPLMTRDRTIWSLQAIIQDRDDKHAFRKQYLKDGVKEGKFFGIGKPVDETLLLCEGLATGLSLWQCTGHGVIVAFDAGNLLSVAKDIRQARPKWRILICADNDQWTTKPVENPGLHYARAAAVAVSALVAFPEFLDAATKPTDFNDLHALEGEKIVMDTITRALGPTTAETEAQTMERPADPDLPLATPPKDGGENGPSRNPYFQILGYDFDRYYIYQFEKKQVLEYSVGALNDGGFIQLAEANWWEQNFRASNGGIDKKGAMNFIMRTANARGIFDPNKNRGRGAWLDDGRQVFHHGQHLTVDGVKTDCTRIKSRFIYQMGAALDTPADTGLTDQEGWDLLDLASKFRWTKSGSAPLLMGWITLAPLCGAIKWRPHIWLTGNAGSGKAQPHSAAVLTPKGWRTIGDLTIGDDVTTPDNGFAKVLNVFPQGKQRVYKLTFGDGRTTRATSDHLWKVRMQSIWRLRTTEQLMEILSRDNVESRRLAVQLAQPLTIDANAELILPIHPYVMGVMLGDGHLGNKFGANNGYGGNPGSIHLTSYDPEIVERVREYLPPGMGLFDKPSKGSYRFGDLSRYGQSTRKLIKELRLLGTRSNDKFIPKQYLHSSIDERIHLLQGLMDTDGTIGGGGLSFCTVSKQLCDDVVYLVRSLGGRASVGTKIPTFTYKGEKRTGQLAYIVGIQLKDRASAFHLKRKKDLAAKDYQYADCLHLNVRSIEEDGEEECSCIVIDHPDQLYVTDNFVVTHNSTIVESFVHGLLHGMDLYLQGNSTEPGIRQKLKSDAIPVIVDETEQNEERDVTRIQSILGLMRQASSESQAITVKGTTFGDAQYFHVRSMFCLSSIQVGVKHEADTQRISMLVLKPALKDMIAAKQWDELREQLHVKIGRDHTINRRLLRRSIDMLPIILENIEVFTSAAARIFKSQRTGDQYGTLLAGAYGLIKNSVASSEDAEYFINAYDWSEHIENNDEDESQRALQGLLEAHIRAPKGIDLSVFEVLSVAQMIPVPGVEFAPDMAIALLSRYGMRIVGKHLLLSNASNELRAIMEGTTFKADWRGVLLRLPGADRNDNKAVRMNGVLVKVTRIDLSTIFDEKDKYVPFTAPAGAKDPEMPF